LELFSQGTSSLKVVDESKLIAGDIIPIHDIFINICLAYCFGWILSEYRRLKKEFIELLEKDKEFRYAVAGYLGISEILKKLDFNREELVSLRQDQNKLWEEVARLRDDFNKMFNAFNLRLDRVERTLEKLTIDIEDEARSIIKHRIKEEMNLDINVTNLALPDLELNIYGVSDDVCIVGEASIRGGTKLVYELEEKLMRLKNKHPDKLRKKIIKILYVALPLPELVEEARKRDIWILKATKDFYKPKLL